MEFRQVSPAILLGTAARDESATQPNEKYLRVVSGWIRNYLCAPHSKLGRDGPVCPFTEPAIKLGQIWMAIAPDTATDFDDIRAAAVEGLEFFRGAPENPAASSDFKAVMILFPHLDHPDGYDLVDAIQQHLKPEFVSNGMMIGQFYRGCPAPGLANPDFRPLFCPVPLLAIRYMVESDIAFLRDSPEWLGHYHRRFRSAPATEVDACPIAT